MALGLPSADRPFQSRLYGIPIDWPIDPHPILIRSSSIHRKKPSSAATCEYPTTTTAATTTTIVRNPNRNRQKAKDGHEERRGERERGGKGGKEGEKGRSED